MALVLKKSAGIATEALDVGEGRMSLVDVVARPEGAPVTAGVAEIWHAAPVEFDYDSDCAVCFMIEGEIELTENGETHLFEPGDVVFIPQQQGLKVNWHTPEYGKFLYVTYPHWR